tara:strand:+ start:41731 stop:42396 length:666 start_codon:yes stop_codon:yes gene_type:complete
MNLSEILSIVIGFFLALVIIDGIRRAYKTNSQSIKVDLIDPSLYEHSESELTELEDKWFSEYEQLQSGIEEDSLKEAEETPKKDNKQHHLFIVHLNTNEINNFTEVTITQALSKYDTYLNSKGLLKVLSKDSEGFTILNGKKPGNFLNESQTNDIALVLDPVNSNSPVQALDFMLEVASFLSNEFSSEILDQDRNSLTNQMIEHMRQKAQEFQRLILASAV